MTNARPHAPGAPSLAVPSIERNGFRTKTTTSPIPIIHYRSRTGLRPWDATPFCAGFKLVEGESSVDRLKLDYCIELDYPHTAAIAEWVEHVSGRDGYLECPLLEIETLASNYAPKVKTATRYNHAWIIKLHGTLHNARRANGGKATIALTVDLNMTRFLANQAESNLPVLDTLRPEELFLQTDELSAVRAVTLDQADNFLVGCARRGGTAFGHRVHWQRRIAEIALAGLDDLLRAHLVPDERNGLPPLGVTIRPATLSQAEVYWEFEVDSALSAVSTISDRLSLASNKSTLRSFFPRARAQEVSGELNGLAISLPLSKAVQAVVYAKTLNVIRLEVRYLKDVRTNAGRIRGDTAVASLIDAVHRDAFSRLNRTRSALMQIAPTTTERADLLEFLRAIDCATSGNQAQKTAILDILVNRGAVAETAEEGFAPRATCEQLVRSGVVERVSVRHGNGEPRRYALTPAYLALRDFLTAGLPSKIALHAEQTPLILQ